MVRYGTAPFLECSTRGDQRFSPFIARLRCRDNRTIESIYQGAKKIQIGDKVVTGLHWRQAKGKLALNDAEVRWLYPKLWDAYFEENLELIEVLTSHTGLSDMFGREGYPCQATELWRIRCAALGIDF